MDRTKIFFISTISIVVLIIIGIVSFNHMNYKNEIEKQELYDYFHTDNGKFELIQKVCEKNGNWKNYPLTSKFRAKYNEKDGYFCDVQFDNILVNEYLNTDYYFSNYPHIVLTQGLKKTAYLYHEQYSRYNSAYDKRYEPGLEDIIIDFEIPIVDENGKELDVRLPFKNEEYYRQNIYTLIDWDGSEKGVATTNHFQDKYPHFLDLFIHYSPLSFNKIKFIGEESDLDNNIAIFEVDSILECKKRKYRVRLILDDKLYLDDAEVELLEEKEYAGSSENSSAKAFYTHSDLNNTSLTDEFIERIKLDGSYYENIDNIDIDFEVDEVYMKNNDTDFIRCYKQKNGIIKSYYAKYIYDNNDKISNIILEELQWENMTAEEVEKLYLKQFNK